MFSCELVGRLYSVGPSPTRQAVESCCLTAQNSSSPPRRDELERSAKVADRDRAPLGAAIFTTHVWEHLSNSSLAVRQATRELEVLHPKVSHLISSDACYD